MTLSSHIIEVDPVDPDGTPDRYIDIRTIDGAGLWLIKVEPDGSLAVTSRTWDARLSVLPLSGNVVELKQVARR